ncbi:MAG: hypothetical protein Q9224_003309, partial [Gallowayella concinna]
MARSSLLRPVVRSLFSPALPIRSTWRPFHNTSSLAGSPLFNLGGLSTSRESQYLSKERGIPRTDFAPHLELIKSSEVEPYATRADSLKNVRRKESRKEPRQENPETPVNDVSTASHNTPDMLYMIKDLQDKTSALANELAAMHSLRKKVENWESLSVFIITVIVLASALNIYSLVEVTKLEESITAAEQKTREKPQASIPGTVDDDSEQERSGERLHRTDEDVSIPANGLNPISLSEWDQLRRNVELLLDAGLRRDEKEFVEEAPASRLKNWF